MEQLTDPHAIMKSCSEVILTTGIPFPCAVVRMVVCIDERGCKFQFLHWDSDLTFEIRVPLLPRTPTRQHLHQQAIQQAALLYYLNELLKKYTHNSARMSQWLDLEQASRHVSINRNSYPNWFRSRERPAQTSCDVRASLEITTKRASASPPRRM